MKFIGFLPLFLGITCFSSPLPADPRILIIGDSHTVGPFGHLLVDELKQLTPKTSLYASCGTVASSWFTGAKTKCGFFFKTEENKVLAGKVGFTPKLPGMLKTLKPDVLVVGLGANYIKGFDEASAVADIAKIIEAIKDQPIECIWVSAPDSRFDRPRRARLYSWVLEAVKDRCRVVDGREFTRYPETEGDGIHYSKESDVKDWVDAVVTEVKGLFREDLF